MGAPKQKWTAEEEAALKAGVVKHGAGKWRTILKDPEFSGVLCLRSNVDLKDKWRNLSVTANGWGSREKARALKRSRQTPKYDGSSKAVGTMYEGADDELMESKSLATTNEILHIAGQKRSFSRIDNLILEAITNLKEPTGSNKTAIATYIEDQYWPPPDFAELLSDNLKELTASGRLIRVKRKYRMTPTSAFPSGKTTKLLIPESRQSEPSRTIRDDLKPFSRFPVDAELVRMRSMTAQQAAAIAAQAVAEAEAAMVEAEAAAREAEAAEADAEAAQAFAEAVMLTTKNKNKSNLIALA